LANGNGPKDGGGGFRARWLIVAGYVAVIFLLSAQPGLHVPGDFKLGDKVAHVLEYGGLGWLLWRAGLETWPRTTGLRRALVAIALASALGAVDEKFQAGVPGRDSSAFDWMADTLGASLAQALFVSREKRGEGT